MSIEFPEIAAIRLGYGLSPLMAPPQDIETVLASAASAGPGPEAMTTARAQEMGAKLAALTKARREGGEAEEAEFTAYNREMGKLLDDLVEALGGEGVRTLDVVCPGFAVDCLETLEEIALQNAELFREHGGETLRYIPCLNADPGHADALAALVARELDGWTMDAR